MPANSKQLRVTYLPVGHGLFTCCDVSCDLGGFRVVYDCGSMPSTHGHLTRCVYDHASVPVDLLVISHAHGDHISGIPDLLRASREVREAWLPYVSPKVRLLFASMLAAKLAHDGYPPQGHRETLNLLVNPERWLSERGTNVTIVGGPDEDPMRRFARPFGPSPAGVPDELVRSSPGMGVSPLEKMPSAFRPQSRFRAYASRLRESNSDEAVLSLTTWVKPMGRAKIESFISDLDAAVGIRGAMEEALYAGDVGLSSESVLRLAEMVTSAGAIPDVRDAYKKLHKDINKISLCLLARAEEVDECLDLRVERNGWPDTNCAGRTQEGEVTPAVLWTGDVHKQELKQLREDAAEELTQRLSRVAFWQVPHHGDKKGYDPEFYKWVDAAAGFVCREDGDRTRLCDGVRQTPGTIIVTEKSHPARGCAIWR